MMYRRAQIRTVTSGISHYDHRSLSVLHCTGDAAFQVRHSIIIDVYYKEKKKKKILKKKKKKKNYYNQVFLNARNFYGAKLLQRRQGTFYFLNTSQSGSI